MTGDHVADAYDRWACSYDVTDNRTRDLDAEVLRRQPFTLDGADVVEFGCGTGKNTAWFADRARSVTAMDFSTGMLAQARERVPGPHVRLLRQDIRQPWPVADATADLVVGNLVLEHVRELAPVFAHIARVLRPGGSWFICELHPYRQLTGKQARFTDTDGNEVRVEAWPHDTGDYLNAAIEAGLEPLRMDEWRDPDDEYGLPRLLSLRGRLRPQP